MANIADIDLGRLLPYADGRRKSFEELMYQLAYSQYKDEIESGKYSITSIDDSGGGDGVEFYITKDDGKIVGWQAKYFRETRFGASQKTQAQRSLQKASEEHGDSLEEWILCSRGTFGVDGDDDESSWFKNIGSKVVGGKRVLPDGSATKARHWNESEIQRRLAENPHIQNYFFNEKALTREWFSGLLRQYEADDRVAKKYIPDVHVNMDEDGQLSQVLGYPEFRNIYEAELSKFEVRKNCKSFDDGYARLLETALPDNDHEAFRQELLKIASPEKENIAHAVLASLDALCDMVTSDRSPSPAYNKLWLLAQEQYRQYDEFVNTYDHVRYKTDMGMKLSDTQYDEVTDFSGYSKADIDKEQKRREYTRNLFGFYDVRLDAFLNIFRCFQSVGQPELHISGAAGHGKTHLAFHTFKSCVEAGRPALFMLAKDLSSIDDIPKLANTPRDWDLTTLLGALEIAGRVAGMHVPVIIDGLNETTNPGSVWHDGIPRLVSMLRAHYPHVVLITTYRSSYKELLFEAEYFKEAAGDYHFSYPFARQFYLPEMNSELSFEAIQKYFGHYKIRLSNGYLPRDVFTHPLYLRLFCEAKNHDRLNEVVIPAISKGDTYGVFRDYIDLAAKRIQRNLGDPRYGNQKVHDTLLGIGLVFWDCKSRSISLKESRLSQEELHAYESEDLLLYRDYDPHTSGETISFTYDAVGGYIIAQTLLGMISSKVELAEYLASSDFTERTTRALHPLAEDTLRALCTLTVERKDLDAFLFEVTSEETILNYSFEEIFETDPTYLTSKYDIVKDFVLSRLKTTPARSNVLGLSEPHWFEDGHPFNFDFVSEWLISLSAAERDLSWSEHIRNNDFEEMVDNFVADLRNGKQLENANLKALWLAWSLTTTVRALRDKSTQALYWYGRNEPEALFNLTKQFIGCNDPYVSERLLAALYGVAMASRGLPEKSPLKEFTGNLIPEIAHYLYDAVFGTKATHPTTHILTRDYAKRIIDLALLSNPDILSVDEQANIHYPLTNYPHPQWREMSDEEIEGFKDNAFPLRMDFDNYTIGRLIPNRMPYDDRNPTYKTVRASIYWRLKDMGFESKSFSTADSMITRLGSYARNSFEERTGKIDRYGKKYSWIAYFEMAGRLNDDEILKEDGNSELAVRMSDIGIDPSFPSLPAEDYYQRMGDVSLLGGDEVEQWLHDTKDIDIQKYLLSNKVMANEDEWILIKARISQEDAEDQTRDTTIDISAILVSADDEVDLKRHASSGKEFRFGIMEGSHAYYTFDGEIPWSPYMPSNNSEDLVVEYGTKFDVTDSSSIVAETLFYSSGWESYHNQLNPSGKTVAPNKDFANKYDLRLIPQTSDMCDVSGKVISRTVYSKLTPFGYAKFAYIRKDALLGYIDNKKLVWATWCEKRWWKDGISSSTHRDTETDFIEHCRLDFLPDSMASFPARQNDS